MVFYNNNCILDYINGQRDRHIFLTQYVCKLLILRDLIQTIFTGNIIHSDINNNSKFSEGDNGRGVGIVSSLASFDREHQKLYLLPILVSDSGKPRLTGTSTLSVVIGDVNDNPMSAGATEITVYKLEVGALSIETNVDC